MADYIVLQRVRLSKHHVPTGKTEHYLGNELLPTPFELNIAQYFDDDGYYLFYLDKNGVVLTDTYHDDIQSAMEQAEWEFGVKTTDWKLSG